MSDLDALDEFNRGIKKLVRFAVSKSRKLDLGGAVKRVNLLINDAPESVLDTLGPGLKQYRDKIMAEDEKFFLDADFSAAIPAEFASEKKEILEVIKIIKKVYSECADAEKREITADLKRLLIAYARYDTSRV